ncbi:hypothetical protein ABPG72_016743 [Tetrahymena utriculariae]
MGFLKYLVLITCILGFLRAQTSQISSKTPLDNAVTCINHLVNPCTYTDQQCVKDYNKYYTCTAACSSNPTDLDKYQTCINACMSTNQALAGYITQINNSNPQNFDAQFYKLRQIIFKWLDYQKEKKKKQSDIENQIENHTNLVNQKNKAKRIRKTKELQKANNSKLAIQMNKIAITLIILNIAICQELIFDSLVGQYSSGQTFQKEWQGNGWSNYLDFAIYGWYKINSQYAGNGWHRRQNFNHGNLIRNSSYNYNVNNDVFINQYSTSGDVDKWTFLYVCYGGIQKNQFSFYQFGSSGVKTYNIPNLNHITSDYYQVKAVKSQFVDYYFPGQLCSFYIIAGPQAYRVSGFEQFQNIQPNIAKNCPFCQQNEFILGYTCYKWCPNNYKQDPNLQACVQCSSYTSDCQACATTCRSCQFGNKNICLDCYETMQYQNGSCTCLNQIDNRNIFYQCSNNKIAVLQAYLASDSPTLTINFGFQLKNDNNLTCDQIFQSKTLNQLGTNPVCTIQQTNIQVQLDQDSTIMETQPILILPSVLQYQSASVQIDTFYLISFTQLRDQPLQFIFQYDLLQDTCNDIVFKYVNVLNDANRKFYSFQWDIQTTPNLDLKTSTQVGNIISQVNSQKSLILQIPKYIIPTGTKITALFSYQMKINSNGTLMYETQYQVKKNLQIEALYSPSVFRCVDSQIYFKFAVWICNQNGPFQFIEPLNIKFTSNVLPILNENKNQFTNQELYLNIKKYQISHNNILDLQISASIDSNQSIAQQQNLKITPILTNLIIYISGGSNGQFNYQKIINLKGLARDLEVEDSNINQDINLTWQCQSLVKQNGDFQCYDYQSNPVILEQNTLEISIPAYTFTPYQILLLTFSGQKDTRSSTQTITALIAEIDIPRLDVQFDDYSQLQVVNLNEDISVTLLYGDSVSSDVLAFSGVVLYKNKQVGIIKFDYCKVKFRIWDYFNNVEPLHPLVQVRFSSYNPSFYMQSITVINFKINLPPNNCQLEVDSATGVALQTVFNIQMTGCKSPNKNLMYQFFYYQDSSDFEQEKLIPNNILRRQIQDISLSNTLSQILPSGNLTIMGKVMDSQFAIYNSTINIKVDPYDQGEQQLNDFLDQILFKQNNYLPQKSVLNLCILGEELSKNYPNYNSYSINQRKVQIISQIINQTSYIPEMSQLTTLSNKIITKVQLSLTSYQDKLEQNILNYISSTLSKQILLMMDDSNKFLISNNIILQNLVDCFKMLNSTTQTINNDLLPSYISISNQICYLLTLITLPNTGGIQLEGNFIQLNCQQITEKNLNQYIFKPAQPKKNQTNLFSIAYSTFSQNPYEYTSDFQNYTQQLKQALPNITIQKNPVIIPQLLKIDSDNNRSPILTNSQMIYQFPNVLKSQNKLSCLQKLNGEWSSQNCESVNNTETNGFYCFCSGLTPTTIIDDLNTLVMNKNLQTAFSSKGINNLVNFSDFYKYAIFWTLVFVTILQICLCCYGQQLDYLQMNHSVQPIFNSKKIAENKSLEKDLKNKTQNIQKNQKIQAEETFQEQNLGYVEKISQKYNSNLEQRQGVFFKNQPKQQTLNQQIQSKVNDIQITDMGDQEHQSSIQKLQKQDLILEKNQENQLITKQDTFNNIEEQKDDQYENENNIKYQKGVATLTSIGGKSYLSMNLIKNNQNGTPNIENIVKQQEKNEIHQTNKKLFDIQKYENSQMNQSQPKFKHNKNKQSKIINFNLKEDISEQNPQNKQQKDQEKNAAPITSPYMNVNSYLSINMQQNVQSARSQMQQQQDGQQITERNNEQFFLQDEENQENQNQQYKKFAKSNRYDKIMSLNTNQKAHKKTEEIYENKQTESSKEGQKLTKKNLIKKKYEIFLKKPFLLRIMMFHEFFNIFYTYDPKFSRPVRFSIFYLRIVHSLCLSTIFDQKYSIIQQILISIGSSLILVTGVALISMIHKITFHGRKISALLAICLLLFCYYIILSIISGEDFGYANTKAISFTFIFSIDFVGILNLMAILKIKLIAIYLEQKKKKLGIICILYKFFDLKLILSTLSL